MRSSALWGRRGGRSSIALTAIAAALIVPVTGIAGNGPGGHASSVPGYLLAQAQADPTASFDVIVQGDRNDTSARVGDEVQHETRDSGTSGRRHGRLKRSFTAVNGVSATLTGSELVKLAQNSHIVAITPDLPLATAGNGALKADVWRRSTGLQTLLSANVPSTPGIAILDSGIDPTRVADWGGRLVARANLVSSEPLVQGDPDGHGTMVAGIAAGGNPLFGGAAPKAKLIDVRVADSQGEAQTSDVIAGIDWILQNRAAYNIRVVNVSLAGRPGTSLRFDPIDQAVEKLWLNGLVVVAAAGNNGSANGPARIAAPANDPFVITVGALDANGTPETADDFRAPWSAYGPTADGFSKPDISAPGRFMAAPVPMGSYLVSKKLERVLAAGYMWMSGTSFSAPIVSGAAAQLLARHPDWTPDMVKGAMMATATPLPGQVGVGIGELNAAAAASLDGAAGSQTGQNDGGRDHGNRGRDHGNGARRDRTHEPAQGGFPNPNEGLNAFVVTEPGTGLNVFDASNWTEAVSASSNWVESNWVESNWVEGLWSASNWVSSNWTASNWVEASGVVSNWVESNWVESNWVE